MESYFKNEYTEIWLKDGIFHITYAPQIRITLEIAKECVGERLRISNGKVYPFFSDTTNVHSLDEDAEKYLASDEAVKLISAGAFFVDNPFKQIMATTFILFNRPPVPAKFFTKYENAIKWLEYYKNLN